MALDEKFAEFGHMCLVVNRLQSQFESGSGFNSVRPFRSGYFGSSVKLQLGYTAGAITAVYLSNSEAHPGYHDEVDIEFLGTTLGKPYTLQTNVYVRGSGDEKNYCKRDEVSFVV